MTAKARAALDAEGMGWASVHADGLVVTVSGTAPDAAARAAALAVAGTVAGPAQLRDALDIAAASPPASASPRIEILRSGNDIDVLGAAPQGTERAALIRALERAAGRGNVSDLMQPTPGAAPEGWAAALGYAATVAAQIASGRVIVTPAGVQVTAITDSPAARQRLQAALLAAKPPDVALTLDSSAPPPVLSPYPLRLERDAAGTRLAACAAESDPARRRIADALVAAGVPAGAAGDCPVALGAPSPQWADAAVAAIAALDALPAGSATLTGPAATLSAPPEVPAAVFDAAAKALRAGLPPGFSLTTEHAAPVQPPAEQRFSASTDGRAVILAGAVPDERMREVVESYARARFGTVSGSLTLNPSVPEGWSVRAIAALEALATLGRGTAVVSPDEIALTGASGDAKAAQTIARSLGRRLGAGQAYTVAAAYDRRLDASLDLPDGPACVARLNAALAEHPLEFAAGKPALAGDPAPAVKALTDALTDCADFRIDLGAYTDSDGPDELNLALSQQRAEAAVEALAAGGAPVGNLVPHGHGEADPVQTNDTPEGRAANRRLAFALLDPSPVVPDLPAPAPVRGTTEAQPDEGGPSEVPLTQRLPPPPDLPGLPPPPTLGLPPTRPGPATAPDTASE